MGGGYGAKLRDERHLAKLVQLARTPDEKGFGDRRIRLVTNFLIGIIHLYRPAGGTTPTPPSLLVLLEMDLDFPPRWKRRSIPSGNGI